jgi:LysR family hydrogen peroxide-inducible transcriptional activator
MISLVQLEYIVALDKYKQFSIAAEKCFVTQPTLSMQIKKLENDLNVILFDRTRQPIKPTDIGLIVINQAKTVLHETKMIEELIQANKKTIVGELRIGIIPSLAPFLLPEFIGDFSKKHKQLQITVKEMLSDEIVSALDTDEIDVGIIVSPISRRGNVTTPLFYEGIFLYCNANHTLAAQNEIDVEQMKDEKIWLLSNGNCFRNQVVNLCDLKEEFDKTSFHYESASIETLVKLVDKEGGLTLIPELAIKDLPLSKKRFVKPFKKLEPVREVSLITNRIFVKKRLLAILGEAIKSGVPKKMLTQNNREIVEWD